MKKSLFLAAALSTLLLPAFSAEWGGVFKNNSKLASDFKNASFKQSDSIFIWANQYLNADGSMYTSEEITYTFDYYSSGTIANTVDVDLFKFTGNFDFNSSKLSLEAGRFLYSDSSNVVFAQNCDGLSVKYGVSMVEISAYAGFTGLLNSNAVTMLDNAGNYYIPKNSVYALSHNLVPVSLGVSFPVLFGNQSLDINGYGFIDIDSINSSRYYGNLKISGPLANKIYYNFATSFGSENFKTVTNYSAADVYIFPVSNVMIDAGAEYASGNDGIFKPFVGVTSRPAYNSALSPETSGVIMVKAAANVSLGQMFIGGLGKVVMAETAGYSVKGVEADVSLSYNIFTDLKVSLNSLVFVDLKDSTENNFSATLGVALAF